MIGLPNRLFITVTTSLKLCLQADKNKREWLIYFLLTVNSRAYTGGPSSPMQIVFKLAVKLIKNRKIANKQTLC